jgi:cob(I)alamin adenosyltransferase
MKLYTRTGDAGTTGLFGGDRVSKCHQRLVAYGTLDELNSALGVLALHLAAELAAHAPLQLIQRDLFALGAVLAAPASKAGQVERRLTHPTWPVQAMEADIDRLTALTGPMTHFVLPGGCPGSAHGHWCRTVCRRAEREVVALSAAEPVPAEVIVYLNRLSDWLFALSRAANAQAGVEDVKWLP